MGRKLLAIFSGLVVAGLLVAFVEFLGHQTYPPPADLDFSNTEQLQAYIQTLPTGAFVFVLVAWFIGAFAGSFTTTKISFKKTPTLSPTFIFGILFLLGCVGNLVMIPHPLWFSISTILFVPTIIYIVASSVARRQKETLEAQ